MVVTDKFTRLKHADIGHIFHKKIIKQNLLELQNFVEITLQFHYFYFVALFMRFLLSFFL